MAVFSVLFRLTQPVVGFLKEKACGCARKTVPPGVNSIVTINMCNAFFAIFHA